MTDREVRLLPALGTLLGGLAAVAVALLVAPDGLEPAERLAVALLRSAIGVVGVWVTLLGLLAALAWLFGWQRALRWSVRLGAARLGLAASVGVASLGVAGLGGSAPAGASEAGTDAPPVASLVPVEPPVASLVPLAADAEDVAADEPPAVHDPAPAADTWIVEQGDHLWAIAEAQVGEGDDREVLDYWERLVELNTDRLVVPDDPDLILPGQELLLPDR